VAPSEKFSVFLGIDEGIKVEHKLIKKYNLEKGVIGKKKKVIYEYLITITNNKKSQEELVVWDQFPISSNQQIKVDIIEPNYKKDSKSLKKNNYNYLEWYFKPKAGEKITIPLKFSVEYPKGKNISGL